MVSFNIIEWGAPVVEWAGDTLYGYQSLAAGLLAILAAWIAARPVWRQLKDSSLQAAIAQRETLVRIMKDADGRFTRFHGELAEPLANLTRCIHEPWGEMARIDPHDAFGIQGQLEGRLDWYLETLRGTETTEIEAAKETVRECLKKLLLALHDVHWIEHNDQHGDDYSIPDDEWEKLLQRNQAAPALVFELDGQFRLALNDLRLRQESWLTTLRSLIAQLDQKIVAATQ